MSHLSYYNPEDLPDLPIEIFYHIGRSLKPLDWYSLSLSNRDIYYGMRRYAGYPYPMNNKEKEAYRKILEFKEEKRIRFISFPTLTVPLPLVNYISSHLMQSKSHRVVILSYPSRMKEWAKALVNKDMDILIIEKFHKSHVRKNRPFVSSEKRIILLPLFNDVLERKIDDWKVSLVISDNRYTLVDLNVPNGIQVIVNEHEILSSNYVEVIQRCRLPRLPHYSYTADRISHLLDNLFQFNDMITLIGFAPQNDAYHILLDDEKNRLPKGSKILRRYTYNYLVEFTPKLSGIVIVQLHDTTISLHSITKPSIHDPIFLSNTIESLYFWQSTLNADNTNIVNLYQNSCEFFNPLQIES